MGTLQVIGIIVGVVSGVSGLVLGILNYRHQRDTTRPRLVVRPAVIGPGTPEANQAPGGRGIMEIRNVGHVPVVGSTIGFLPACRTDHGFFFPATETESIEGGNWTDELKPQHAVYLRFNLQEVPQAKKLGRAYAKGLRLNNCSNLDRRRVNFRHDERSCDTAEIQGSCLSF